ncbi:MAG: hypothetical protein ACRC7S_16885 [Cetobacterium sp.]
MKIMEVLEKAKQYPNDIDGVKKLLNECGGKNFLNAALNFADKPKVKEVLKQFGADEQISSLKRELGGTTGNSTTTPSNSLKDRLKNL